MSKINLPNHLLKDFFMAISSRRLNEAEKILQEIVGRIEIDSEFKRGFLQGLKGIFHMCRSNNQYTFLSILNSIGVDRLREFYDEFMNNAKRRLRPDYDKGYFSALAEYLHFLLNNVKVEQKKEI